MSTAFSLAPLFRSSVGFDRFNDLFETALRNEPGSSYPPYNVENTVMTNTASSLRQPVSRKKTWSCKSRKAC
jgi:hypothetical protein